MAQIKLGKSPGMYIHIRMLCGAYAGQKTGCHIAHSIAASLTRGYTNAGQFTQDGRRILQTYKMGLKILPRGDMRKFGRIQLTGMLFHDIANNVQLHGR